MTIRRKNRVAVEGEGGNICSPLVYEATVGCRVVAFACIPFDGGWSLVEVQSGTHQSGPVESTGIYRMSIRPKSCTSSRGFGSGGTSVQLNLEKPWLVV